MKYYFAPMEGITDSIFRRVHHRHFPGVDRYFMPFFSPSSHRSLSPREARELPQSWENPFRAVPQLLTKSPEDFLWAAVVCRDRGYEEVNLNLGCPSGTVVSKGKGSGMLRDPEVLDAFLEEIFTRTPLPVSVKTRLGLERPEEFTGILEVFNRYPIRELTVHPRVRRQFYSGGVDMELFDYAAAHSRAPLCYNGDVLSLKQAGELERRYPALAGIMIGRGLLADPGMLSGGTEPEVLERYMTELMDEYEQAFGSSRNAMFRLKENWGFLYTRFQGSEKLWKRLRKTTDSGEFRAIAREIIKTCPLKEPAAL